MRDGSRVGERPPLREAQQRFAADLAQLPPEARRISGPVAPRPVFSEQLTALSNRVRHRIETEYLSPART
jgi:nicotinate phosphoribosyltransferase